MATKLKAPFPAFGGKSAVAETVWNRLGDVDNYIEPFANSAAVLLARPHAPKVETINDVDSYVANFWRAIQRDPEQVAYWADAPVNEADLHSRHRWLVGLERPEPDVPEKFSSPELREAYLAGFRGPHLSYIPAWRERIRTDPEHYDAKIAGWWVWGACCWIGAGWCSYAAHEERRPRVAAAGSEHGDGVHKKAREPTRQVPLDDRVGVHAQTGRVWQKMPRDLGGGMDAAAGSNRPQLADTYARGRGVHGNDGAGTCEQRRQWLLGWFHQLADRLRTVRVCCGDWLRVCDSPSVTTRLGTTGLFLDPPYAHSLERFQQYVKVLETDGDPMKSTVKGRKSRDKALYSSDMSEDVDLLVARVHHYCRQRGALPGIRIVLAGYEGEHEALETLGWEVIAWEAQGGYGNRGKNKENRNRERIWVSPACVDLSAPLFESLDSNSGA